MPRDVFGREIDYLRISVIDHCNLRCVYCMPLRGLTFVPSDELLTAAEIERVARAGVGLGFRKFRLTGGEPTLRPDLVEIVRRIASVPGAEDVAMTTNAILLPRRARPRRRGGGHGPQREPAAAAGPAAARGGPAPRQRARGHARPRAAQAPHALRHAGRD